MYEVRKNLMDLNYSKSSIGILVIGVIVFAVVQGQISQCQGMAADIVKALDQQARQQCNMLQTMQTLSTALIIGGIGFLGFQNLENLKELTN